MNIRELDEESRRTGVWPPRRIILRAERTGEVAESPGEDQGAAVKVTGVELAAPPTGVWPPPRRMILRVERDGEVAASPAFVGSPEDAAYEKWLAEPLAIADCAPEYQELPARLPDDVRLRAERRHLRVARKARTQLFGASAATTLAVGGCVAALGLFGLSQTESVGGSLGVPSIGSSGTAPEPPSGSETPDAATPKPAANKALTEQVSRQPPAPRAKRAARPESVAESPGPTSAPARRSAPSASRAPSRSVANRPVQPQRRVANPPPPAPASAPKAAPQAQRNSSPQSTSVVGDAPSQPRASAPSRPATAAPSRPAITAPSRPASSAPPTTNSPTP